MISLSICIPVFRQVPTDLLRELEVQAARCTWPVEILVMDDGSEPEFRQSLRSLRVTDRTRMVFLELNVGRSRIRNLLAARAAGEYLLFLDGDSGIPDEAFLTRYLSGLPWEGALCGGRIYTDQPAHTDWKLHWAYGKHLESRTAQVRNRQPYRSFMTNNFLVSKEIVLNIPFNEALTHYGHEDTWFGYELFAKGVPIRHIDNPVIHLELDGASSFLEKTRIGLHNLGFLERAYATDHPGFKDSVTLLRMANHLKNCGFNKAAGWLFWMVRPLLESYLLGKNPGLIAFQIYKLGYFCAFVAA